MNGRTILVILIIILLLIIGWAFYTQTVDDNGALNGDILDNDPDLNGDDLITQSVEGEITNIDRSQNVLDGPTVINLETDTGLEYMVAVPSMGINLCAAVSEIEDVATLEAGTRVEVRGQLNDQGQIVPCDSALDYLRVVADNNADSTTATTTSS